MKTIVDGCHPAGLFFKGSKIETVLKRLAFLIILGASPGLLSAQFSISFGVTEPTCWLGSDGFITANISGGTAPYTFLWSTGQTTQTIGGVRAGTYSVTVKDANQNSKSASVEVVQPPQIKGTFIFSGCSYPTYVKVVVKGGWPPYTYKWENGSTADSIKINEDGKYCVTIVDANGCRRIECAVVELSGLDIWVDMDMVSCPGEDDGELKVTVKNGEGPITFKWSNGATGPIISNLPPGEYSVTATDNAGCTATATAIVKDKPEIKIDLEVEDPICEGDENGSIEASASGGTAPYTYQWNTGANTALIDGLGAGVYSVTVTDANGCKGVKEVELFPLSTLKIIAKAIDETCPDENNGVLMVQGLSGAEPYSYLWSNGAVSAIVNGVAPGIYSVTVTDALGCSKEAAVEVDSAAAFEAELDVTEITVCGGSDGMIEVLLDPDTTTVTYDWSNGETTAKINNLGSGEYTVTITNLNECSIVLTTTLTAPPSIDVDVTASPLVCPGEETGQAMATPIGGTAPYDYNWSSGQTTQSISNLAAGTYIVTVTDVNDCFAVDSVTIEESPELLAMIDATMISCDNIDNGSASVVADGGIEPYTYLWSNDSTTAMVSGLSPGDYSVTVTDSLGCTKVLNTTILADSLKLVLIGTDIDCYGDSTGMAMASASDGMEPYSYLWNTGETTAGIDGLPAGTYTVTLTDGKGCEEIDSITITQPDSLELMISDGVEIDCFGDSTGSVTVMANGGTGYHIFTWQDQLGSPDTNRVDGKNTRDGLPTGIYKVVVTDSLGCMAMMEVIIEQPDSIELTLEKTDLDCTGDGTGTISAFVVGGTKPFTFNWSNGADTSELSDLQAGTYILTLTDANGCELIDSVTLVEPDTLNVSIVNLRGACEDVDNGELVVVATGGTEPYSYSWSNEAETDTIRDLAPGEYTVTVTDANGCITSIKSLVEEYPDLECTITILQNETSPGANDGRASVTPVGGVGPYTYLWSNGQTTQEATGLSGGGYSVTVTDSTGCTTSCEINLLILSGLGNYVWEDINRNGIQDDDEPGVPDIPVKLKDKDDIIIARDTTDADGFYSFLDLLPDTYSVMFEIDSVNYNYTFIDEGVNDSLDSDVDLTTMQMTPQVTLASGEINFTLDAGIYRRPGVGMDPCECLNNATQDGNGQFSERITVMSYPGETWTVVDLAGLYKPDGPEPPADPIPIEVGTELTEVQPGIYELNARLVDGEVYLALSAGNIGIDTVFTTNICFYPTLNMDEIPGDSICVLADPLELSSNPSIPGEVKYFLNGEEITEIDPSILEEGDYEFIAQLLPFDTSECEARIVKQISIHNQCLAMIGDTVWLDQNRNGLQDPSEVGIGGVRVIAEQVDELSDSTDLFRDTMFTDENGKYLFTVPPGIYKVTFEQPEGLSVTTANAGDDTRDSDIDPETLMTGLYVVNAGDVNLTIDAGFYDICINVTDPGKIGYDQMLCGPGQDPNPIIEIEAPTGGEGDFEYLWMKSTISPIFNMQDWEAIPNSNTPNYDPGPIFETTYFTRCVRREGCVLYLEPEPVVIKVNENNNIDIVVPEIICVGKAITFKAETNASSVRWEFDGPATPQTSNGKTAIVTYNDFGPFEVRVYGNAGGCPVFKSIKIFVLNNPVFCGSNLEIDLTVQNEKEVSIEWSMADDGTNYEFEVERSADGFNFEPIARVTDPKEIANNYKHYEYMDAEAKRGRNYYRVKIFEQSLDQLAFTSEIKEIIVYGDSKLLLVYPNPVINDLKIEVFETLGDPVEVQLFTINGVLLQTHELEPETQGIQLNMENYPKGTYFLKVQFGKTLVKRYKLVRY